MDISHKTFRMCPDFKIIHYDSHRNNLLERKTMNTRKSVPTAQYNAGGNNIGPRRKC